MKRRDWLKTIPVLGASAMINPMDLLATDKLGTLKRSDFGSDFDWGVATAAYQIEGGFQADGKGESIWDHFSHNSGKIKDGSSGDRACNFYNLYKEDITLMKSMGIPNYRFSLSWSRILPKGTGTPNVKGLDFYDRVIDTCLEKGVKPWITLYHWDLPQVLEEKGGWANRDILKWFSDYTRLVTQKYGDRVKDWMVLNEPMAFVALGYLLGMHAPGKRSLSKFLAATHHASMAQAAGGRIIRKNVKKAHIGTTFSASSIHPAYPELKHQRAAKRADAMLNRLFLEPALGLGYPTDAIPALKRINKYVEPGDMDLLPFDFDFIGLQNYTRSIVKSAIFPPVLWAKELKPEKRNVEVTEMGWEVYPEGIYELLKKFDAYPQIKKIIVTENGAAFPDQLDGNKVHDSQRKKFYQEYLSQVLKAKDEGVNVKGYFAWTFMDNFEWAEGYKPRFGLVHVDFKTQKRTIKDSGLWFKSFLTGK